jgi:hypothetical protein
MPRARLYLLALLLLAFFASTVAAQIYRWVDEKGTVHFTDERPRNRSGVKEVVEAGAKRTPMVRGGPERRVDTPTPDHFDRTGRRDDFYDDDFYDDEYGEEGRADYGSAQQGDTIIEVYEPPPWFDDRHKQPHERGRKRDGDHGRHDRRRDGDHGRSDRGRDGDHGRRDRNRGSRPPSAVQPPPNAAPAAAPARSSGRAASRALPPR